MKMQLKLTLVLVFVGLISCTLVGLSAYFIVQQDFRQEIEDQAFEGFQTDFVAYVVEYGNLEKALKAEPFHNYVIRLHKMMGPDNQVAEPTGLANRWEKPPFRHIVKNSEGIVILGGGMYEEHTPLPEDESYEWIPIEVRGEVIAYAATEGIVALAPEDVRYLNAIGGALKQGAIAAVACSILLGIVFGRGLSRTVRKLTDAIRKMHDDSQSEHHVQVSSNDELGELAAAFNEMNSELVQVHGELRDMSIKDPLTGLYNRRYFDEQAKTQYEQACRYDKPVSVMIGDLDHFKQINDEYSHEMGDQVLKEVSEILVQTTRKSDVVARWGGEEFVILFPSTSADQAAVCCEKIRKAIEAHSWEVLHPQLGVTMSIGVCDDITTGNIEKMLSQADQFLYTAKQSGRNRVLSRTVS